MAILDDGAPAYQPPAGITAGAEGLLAIFASEASARVVRDVAELREVRFASLPGTSLSCPLASLDRIVALPTVLQLVLTKFKGQGPGLVNVLWVEARNQRCSSVRRMCVKAPREFREKVLARHDTVSRRRA